MNRQEIIFCYDLKDGNPNGDPMDSNKPRLDEETGINIVTDVRLKRTVRDYWKAFMKKDLLIERIEDGMGGIADAKKRTKLLFGGEFPKDTTDATIKNKVLQECIDARVFGCVLPYELPKKAGKNALALTGAVQFSMGRSLNRVELKLIKGTGAFASKEGLAQETFREEFILPYSFICFYGIFNENAAKDTKMTEEDLKNLYIGMWNGTKNVISRTKIGQVPQFLLVVTYKEENYQIGDLSHYLKIKTKNDLPESEIRSTNDFTLDASVLMEVLSKNKAKIQKIEYKTGNFVKFTVLNNGKYEEISAEEVFARIGISEIKELQI